jgi:hypothetical protein
MEGAGLQGASSICTTQHPANVLTGIFNQILRHHFSDPDRLEYNGKNEFTDATHDTAKKELEGYVWHPDNTQTKIQIESVWDINLQDIQRRPGMYVKRNALQPRKIAINHGFSAGGTKDAEGRLLRIEGDYHSVLVQGSHTLFAVGQAGAEAELLGQEVFELMLQFGPLLRSEMHFQSFETVECGEVSVLEEATTHFAVPIVVGYAYPRTWRIEKVAPWLKAVAVDACAR